MSDLKQFPVPGKHMLCYCGDKLEIRLTSSSPLRGKAYLCTNIGNAEIRNEEIISEAEEQITAGSQDWRNLPMERVDEATFVIRLALTEEGHFEAKCCLVADLGVEPEWVNGDNLHVNVSPAPFCCANSVYCAFVRQFGSNKNKEYSTLPENITAEQLKQLDGDNYSVIPQSGTFRGLIKELDHIINRLKCRIIHLLPVNPTPTVYGRMGRFGSPYASLDFTAVDPALAEFDRKATPLDQFLELVDAVHRKKAKLFIDIAINHTGWASKLQEEHPDWFVRDANGEIHSPGAWGVVWGDLTELDHRKPELWRYLAQVFLTWCSRGVDGFRCDAGYMIPAEAWEYIIARVRLEYPETIFLLEGLGGDPAVTNLLLDSANMDWAYSELFQNYSRQQVEGYLNYAWSRSSADGLMIHYAETHDNARLAAVSQKYARMRTALCALASSNGAFGFANGVEWFAREKIDVHEASALNWDAPVNQVDFIAGLNVILALHPSFHNGAMMSIVDSGSPQAVLFSRSSADGRQNLLIAVNLDCAKGADVVWNASNAPFEVEKLTDLLSGRSYELLRLPQNYRKISLSGGQAVCLTDNPDWLVQVRKAQGEKELIPEHLEQQEAAAMALHILVSRNNSQILLEDDDPMSMARALRANPEGFLHKLYDHLPRAPFVHWNWPEDVRREVMLAPGHCMLVTAPYRFRFTASQGGRIIGEINGIADDSGRYFAVLPPLPVPEKHTKVDVAVSMFTETRLERQTAHVLLLAEDVSNAKLFFSRKEIYHTPRTFLQGNGRGAIMHKCMERGMLSSRYDAILLANLNPDYPEDRHVMWRRVRLWVVYHARLQSVKPEHISSFYVARNGGGIWNYDVPVGNGLFIELTVKYEIMPGENTAVITIYRKKCHSLRCRLSDNSPVRVIARADIEDRNFHYSTKAASGPERIWPGRITTDEKGFVFRPAPDRILRLHTSHGSFKRDDEWTYMIYQANEAARGLDPHTDLYSPGYFRFYLAGDETAYLGGQVVTAESAPGIPLENPFREPLAAMDCNLETVMLNSIRQFIVKRGKLKTVIAGYPWFLDWGRDTLIAARGLIAAPEFREDVKSVLMQFASFAEKGTIPNMISGADARNRDTSDAPLWLFTACADLCRAEDSADFLQQKVRGEETLLDVLESLAEGIIAGTPNGIVCDPESSLVFSPAHFTWMDTNYPAGTPREGYPVEIQALWYAALSFLAVHSEHDEKWRSMAKKVQMSILKYYLLPDKNYLSDCLHASPGIPAASATADDHLRPNQLLAITLGAVTEPKIRYGILQACSKLLIPGAIRSLADAPTAYRLPVCDATGRCLNDPQRPYWGHYEGDEDTRRKPAYHNGTAWTWQFPSFAEAYWMTYGENGRRTAKSVLSTMCVLMDSGCVAQVPEILDGDYPHTARGCDAQAWGITEFYRIWKQLHQ